MTRRMFHASLVALGALGAPAIGQEVVTTFDNGNEGWSISGRDNVYAFGGNPGANLGDLLIDVFGADTRNNTHPDFLGDLSRYGPMELSIDIKVNSINFFFEFEVARDLVVELRDSDNPNGYPWTSVWYNLGVISLEESLNSPTGWIRYSVIIEDPWAEALPPGWGGTGDEDPETIEPILPKGRTFASVLASVDEIAFTTFVPGFFFGFHNFDMQVDNITIRSIGCRADWDGVGGLDSSDFLAYLNDWSAQTPRADLAPPGGDGAWDSSDFLAYLNLYANGCGD